jgi:hypothetical protein
MILLIHIKCCGRKDNSIDKSSLQLNKTMFLYVQILSILENVWNANQICLNLLVPKNIINN